MIPGIESYLQEYGVTNLIDIDGLLYAPVSDLWRFYRDYTIDRFVFYATVPLSLVLFGLECYVIGGFIAALIRRKKSETK